MRKIFTVLLVICFAFSFGQELALVREDGLFGYINKSGEYVIQPQFSKAKSFSEGYAAVEKNKAWGFIDTKGAWAIEPTYDKVKYFNSGYVLVLKDDEWRYIDSAEKELEVPATEKYFD